MKQNRLKYHKRELSQRQLEFLEIFRNKSCLVTKACRAAKLSRAMFYRWLEQPAFKSKVEGTKLDVKDFGEDALFDLMRKGNPAAVIFFNKCRNKDRGYIEKSEQSIEHKGEGFKLIIEAPDEQEKNK